jgi:hypothetical protein
MPTLGERLEGGLLGLLIGDALGVPYEFHEPAEIPPAAQIEFTPPARIAKRSASRGRLDDRYNIRWRKAVAKSRGPDRRALGNCPQASELQQPRHTGIFAVHASSWVRLTDSRIWLHLP